MSTLTDLRAATAATLDDVPGEVLVRAGATDYPKARGFTTLRVTVRVTLGPETDQAAEDLDELIAGERSVKAALEGDEALGELVSSLAVIGCSGARLYAAEPEPLLGAEWTVETLIDL